MNENKGVCPGCRKGCSVEAPRCRYGKMYFARQNSVSEADAAYEAPFTHKKKRKWEKHVDRDSLAWRFLMVGRGMKKLLLEGRIAEAELFDGLSNSEKQALAVVLEKLGRQIYCR